jgi:M6 family metalloprotease-like protein
VRGLVTLLGSLGVLTIVAVSSAAPDPGTLRVRPVSGASAAARQAPRPGTAVVPDARLQVEQQRLRRWASFDDVLSAPGMDWSKPSRRAGWRPPPRPAPPWAPHDVRGHGEAIPPDTLRVAFLRVDFATDRGGSASTGDGRFDLSGPDTLQPPIDRAPRNRTFYERHVEALARYWDVQSYGRVVIDGDVWPRSENGAYTVSDMADFGPWKFSQEIYRAAVHMYRTMMFAADSQSVALGDRIPWDSYDRFVIIHAGGDLQSDLRQDSPEDIPSFTIGVVDTDVVIFPDSTARPIDRAMIVPETINQDGYYGALNGVMAHEAGHLFFNMADLYNIQNGFPVVGYWSLMDSGNLVGSIVVLPDSTELFATGLLPPSVDPFQKTFISEGGFVPVEVDYGDTTEYRSIQRHRDVRKVTLSSDEYLLLENRYLAPAEAVSLDQDSVTRVILGPKDPDRYEYDALLPGGGMLVWHIDESVIPLEAYFPVDTALRANPDLGWNTNYARLGVSVIEADALRDLGDPGSPFLLGAPFDPWFRSNNPTLSDTTKPSLIPHIGTRPHARLDFLDEPDSVMQVAAFRTWMLPGWPVATSFPPGGPVLLAVEAVDDRRVAVCWAGGDTASADSSALFGLHADGTGIGPGGSPVFARLNRKVRPEMAAIPMGKSFTPQDHRAGPALFAVSTYADRVDSAGNAYRGSGEVWLVDHNGAVMPGWPAALPAGVTTPPVTAGFALEASVYVGCEDGRIYRIGLDGQVIASSPQLWPGGVTGRLALDVNVAAADGLLFSDAHVAAGGALGHVGVVSFGSLAEGGSGAVAISGWPVALGTMPGYDFDFLWIDFNGAPPRRGDARTDLACAGERSLVVHRADRLWAYCVQGQALPGWGAPQPDTLVDALGAGDPDGDGYPEVLVQTLREGVGFVNVSGRMSPGWPRRPLRKLSRSGATPLALDVDGDNRSEVVALTASGVLAALRADGATPPGWPLATGVGATGSPIAADLNGDAKLDIVAPDRFGHLYAYTTPHAVGGPTVASPWIMLGGDVGRTSSLPEILTPAAPEDTPGPLVAGSLKAYPNPARRLPVSFAYQLSEPADVEFRILDASGHEVASFTRSGRPADNLEVWDPGALPAGLYLARIRFRAGGGERIEVLPVALLR